MLAEAIASVLNQTWQDFELIVLDDGSTDDTAQVLRTIADARVIVLRNDQPSNAAAARNVGAAKASGSILSFLDDDDRYLPAKLERTVAQFAASERIGVVLSSFDLGSLIVTVTVSGNVLDKLTQRFYTLPTSIISVRREVFDALGGFDASLTPSEDFDFCVRAARMTEFASISEPLVFHRQHGHGRLIDNVAAAETSFRQMLTKNFPPASGASSAVARALWNSWKGQGEALRAKEAYRATNLRVARRSARLAVRYQPSSAKRWLQAALIHFVPRSLVPAALFNRRSVKL